MLIFGKPYDPHMAQADLNQVIESVFNEIEPSLLRKRIQHEWVPAPEPTFIRLDERGIHWALYNLINSCAAACKEATYGKIKLTVDLSDDENAVITITDNSPPSQSGRKEDVFSPGVKAPDHKMNPVELAVSRKLIEGHNGTVCLKSSPTGGNLFLIELPLKQTDPSDTHRSFGS